MSSIFKFKLTNFYSNFKQLDYEQITNSKRQLVSAIMSYYPVSLNLDSIRNRFYFSILHIIHTEFKVNYLPAQQCVWPYET